MGGRLRLSLEAGEGRSAPGPGEGGYKARRAPLRERQLGALTLSSRWWRMALLPACADIVLGAASEARAATSPKSIMVRILLVLVTRPGGSDLRASNGRPAPNKRENRTANL